MPMRPSSDRPINDPLSRAGFVQKQDIDGDPSFGIVAFPGYGRQPAENSISQRSRVRSRWQQEAGVWTGLNRPANVSDEVLVDGREGGTTGLPGANGEYPAVGWKVSASGFDARFPAATYPSEVSVAGRIVLAVHPSGRAVVIGDRTGGQIEVYEWLPGIGFGRKYATMWADYLDPLLKVITGDATFQAVYPNSVDARLEFSPDGRVLAVAGINGQVNGFQVPAMVWPFSLASGIDQLHPITPNAIADPVTLDSLGAGMSLSWTADSRSLLVGCEFGFAIFPVDYTLGVLSDPVYPGTQPTNACSVVRFRPGDDYFAVGCDTGFSFGGGAEETIGIYPWDGATIGTVVTGFSVNDDLVNGLEWLPDGLHFLWLNSYDDGGTDYGLFAGAFNPAGGGSVTGVVKYGDLSAWQGTLGLGLSPAGDKLVVIGQSPDAPDFDSLGALFTVTPSTGACVFVVQTSWKYSNPESVADVKFRPGAA